MRPSEEPASARKRDSVFIFISHQTQLDAISFSLQQNSHFLSLYPSFERRQFRLNSLFGRSLARSLSMRARHSNGKTFIYMRWNNIRNKVINYRFIIQSLLPHSSVCVRRSMWDMVLCVDMCASDVRHLSRRISNASCCCLSALDGNDDQFSSFLKLFFYFFYGRIYARRLEFIKTSSFILKNISRKLRKKMNNKST